MKKPGFTLIELLVVVAIIALLISILMPALGQARNQAKTTVCASRLYQIGTALYCYWTEWNGRVPYVVSPMTNGFGNPPRTPNNMPGFGNAAWPDDDLDPFNRCLWPNSLPNVLMPQYIGSTAELFVCPSARLGWPRKGGAYRYTYREAAANQPRGLVNRPGIDLYFSEHFGFMDGRMYKRQKLELTGDPLRDSEQLAYMRGTFIRDLVDTDHERQPPVGPHRGGINVLNRDLQVEFRNQQTINEDLNPNLASVAF
jgi:prepilin-type N-terminal cleavage/methylation domain-containing protein